MFSVQDFMHILIATLCMLYCYVMCSISNLGYVEEIHVNGYGD